MSDETCVTVASPAVGDLASLTDSELAEAVLVSEVRIRRHRAALYRLVVEAHERGVARAMGYRDTAALLARELVLTRGEAVRLVNRARGAYQVKRDGAGRGPVNPR